MSPSVRPETTVPRTEADVFVVLPWVAPVLVLDVSGVAVVLAEEADGTGMIAG
jgi:hypothetical protein